MDFFWKTKKNLEKKRRSSTRGKDKPNGTARPEHKIFAKRSRSYKMNGYTSWCEACNAKNKAGASKNKAGAK